MFPFKSFISQEVAESAFREGELILAISGAFIQSCISKPVFFLFSKETLSH